MGKKKEATVVTHCGDDRYQGDFTWLIRNLGLVRYFPFIRTGSGAHPLHRNEFFKEIEFISQKRQIKSVILIGHAKCQRYRSDGRRVREQNIAIKTDLKRLADNIRSEFKTEVSVFFGQTTRATKRLVFKKLM